MLAEGQLTGLKPGEAENIAAARVRLGIPTLVDIVTLAREQGISLSEAERRLSQPHSSSKEVRT